MFKAKVRQRSNFSVILYGFFRFCDKNCLARTNLCIIIKNMNDKTIYKKQQKPKPASKTSKSAPLKNARDKADSKQKGDISKKLKTLNFLNKAEQAVNDSAQDKRKQKRQSKKNNAKVVYETPITSSRAKKQPLEQYVKNLDAAAQNTAKKLPPQLDFYPEDGTQSDFAGNITKPPKGDKKLKIIFLGGVGEIGKNMTAFEYGNDIVIVDAGSSFPTAEMPGVDVVIPDITYLKENRSKIRGLLLTHGHEDHIGGVPYLLKEINMPVYGSKLTLALVENKLVEQKIENYKLVQVDESSDVNLGVFKAEFVHVCHSIADSMAIALKTPVGMVFLTGDFKIDYTPIGGQVMNLHRIAEIGKNGVAVLMAESTNVERAGYTMSEVVVTETLRKVFAANAGRRLIVATFASNVDRVQQIIDIAKDSGRKISLGGRSMLKVVDTARKAGMLSFDENDFVDIDKADKIPDGQLCILSTGTQGEPMSALTRMASGQFNKINIGQNDTIVISASPIPGNEKDIYKVINNLYRLGANVIYSSLADVHVSGHACKEELKLMHSLLKPKFFIPIHGEYRHLCQHSRLAQELGTPKNNIVIPEIGDVVEVTSRKISIKGKVPSGIVLVDGLVVGDVGQSLLKDRKTLAEEGIVIVMVGVNTTNGIITSGPEIISRGCIYTGDDSNSAIIEDLKNLASNALADIDLKELNVSITKQLLQKPIKNYFRKKYDRYPMIIPIILEN